MVQAGIPLNVAQGWVIKSLDDLKNKGVTSIVKNPWGN